jgi:hypothetical protein
VADIFISYESSDRPRAERLRAWFEEYGWSVWIDHEIHVGDDWDAKIKAEVRAARVVVVLWGAQARRSTWVVEEASEALDDGRLIQIQATGLPLLPPFDTLQALRMQSWSGEAQHSERTKLLLAVAERLGSDAETVRRIRETADVGTPTLTLDAIEIAQVAFEYCARQVELHRSYRTSEAAGPNSLEFVRVREAFAALEAKLSAAPSSATDDREGSLHRMVTDFLDQLELLAPTPGLLR